MPADERVNKRHFPPSVFGKPYRQDCLSPGCDGVLRIDGVDVWGLVRNTRPNSPFIFEYKRTHHEPGLREGQCWGCPKCYAVHEFYREYASSETRGVRLEYGVVRLQKGNQDRDKGEPKPGEFVE